MLSKNKKRLVRKRRVNAVVSGTAERPRVSLFRSQRSMSVQFIDDISGKVLVSGDNKKEAEKKFDVQSCEKLGESLAKILLEKKIDKVVFDRSGYRYHGKIKAVADGLRKGGLKF